MTPTLTELEKKQIAQCRQNHSGQVRPLLDIIDRLRARIVELEKENERLQEKAWMYDELCK